MNVNLDKAYKTFGKRAEEKTDLAVFTCIAEHTKPEGKAWVPQSIIADETGYTRRTVSNSIHRLAEKRLLTIEKTLTDNTGTVRGMAGNIYHINPKYLTKTKPAQHNTKPQCAACYQGGPHVVSDYLSGWKLVTNDGEGGKHVDPRLGPQVETIHENGSTTIIRRSFLQRIDYPSQEEIQVALGNRQVIYRYKNKRVQVLAQTLSSFLDTRTSSLLAVNKKQGVPRKFIHRMWKVTWVDLEGLKKRVEHTEHGSALLKGLKQVIQCLDELTTPDDRKVKSASAPQPEQEPKSVKSCDLAVEANKRAVHNTERLNKLEKYTDSLSNRVDDMETDVDGLAQTVRCIEAGDKKAVQAMREKQTPFDALSQRVSGILTHADRLDTKMDGLVSRVSVLEDTSKWLSWTLIGVLSLRFLSLMLRLLRRK